MPTADPDELPVVTAVFLLLFMFDSPGADAEGFVDMQHGFLAGVDPELCLSVESTGGGKVAGPVVIGNLNGFLNLRASQAVSGASSSSPLLRRRIGHTRCACQG